MECNMIMVDIKPLPYEEKFEGQYGTYVKSGVKK